MTDTVVFSNFLPSRGERSFAKDQIKDLTRLCPGIKKMCLRITKVDGEGYIARVRGRVLNRDITCRWSGLSIFECISRVMAHFFDESTHLNFRFKRTIFRGAGQNHLFDHSLYR